MNIPTELERLTAELAEVRAKIAKARKREAKKRARRVGGSQHEANKRRRREARENYSDGYVRANLRKRGLEITPEAIEAQRAKMIAAKAARELRAIGDTRQIEIDRKRKRAAARAHERTEKGAEARKKNKRAQAKRNRKATEKRACDELRRRYVRDLLKNAGFKGDQITEEMIEVKRVQVEVSRIARAIHDFSKQQTEGNTNG